MLGASSWTPEGADSGFVAWQRGGRAREHAPDCRQGTGARAVGALPGSDPTVFSLRHADTWVQAQRDELAEERSACTYKLVCAFILEFP